MRFGILIAVLLVNGVTRLLAGPAAGFILQPTTANTSVPFELTDQVVWLGVELTKYPTREAATPVVVKALNRDSQPVASYRGTVHFTADPSIDVPADYTFTEADAGTHTFTVVFHRGYVKQFQVVDGDGASGSAEVYVQCPDLTLTATNDGPVCSGSSATLSAFTNATAPEFLWEKVKGGSPETNQTGQTVVVTLLGLWHVGMTDADTGCYLDTTTNAETERGPEIDAPSESLDGSDFTASIAADSQGPYSGIVWTVTHGTIVSGEGTPTITIHPDAGATEVNFNVALTRIATSCYVSSESYTRIVPIPLSADITTAAEVCPNATGRTASVRDAGAGTTYTWTVTNGTIVSGQGTPTIVFDAPAEGTVHIAVYVVRLPYGMSGEASVMVGPSAEVITPNVRMCASESETIAVALHGTAPFTIVWSDGVEQSGIMSDTATRTVSPEEPTSYSVTSVSDAMCTGDGEGSVLVDVIAAPEIVRQPSHARVQGGATAVLTVGAEGDGMTFRWYEGKSGDRSKLVATGLPTFTTPPLTKTTSYWVAVENDCGVEESATAVVAVGGMGRRRSAGH